MKVYVAMMTMNKNEEEKYYGLYSISISDYDPENDIWKCIYGFTDKKKLFDKFISARTGLRVFVYELDEDEYHDFKVRYKDALIEKRWIEHRDSKEVQVPMTTIEHQNCTEYSQEFLYEDYMSLAKVHPCIFKDGIEELLTLLGYSNGYYNHYGTEAELELFDYNSSFTYADITRTNSLGLFLNLYKDFVKSDVICMQVMKEVSKGNERKKKEGY